MTLTQKFKDSHVSQFLKLLSDFVADVFVVGMELLQVARVFVNIAEAEALTANSSNHVQHIQCPASLGGIGIL